MRHAIRRLMEDPGIHAAVRVNRRARRGREHRGLQPGGCAAAAAVAVQRSATAGEPVGEHSPERTRWSGLSQLSSICRSRAEVVRALWRRGVRSKPTSSTGTMPTGCSARTSAPATFGCWESTRRWAGRSRDQDDIAHPAVILSHGLWRSRFGGDPNILGRTDHPERHAVHRLSA